MLDRLYLSVDRASLQLQDAKKLSLTANVYDANMREQFSRQENLDAAADSPSKVFVLPEIPNVTPVYFLKPTLTDESEKLVGSNFYWLSKKPETITHGTINVGDGFAQTHADFRSLSQLQKATVRPHPDDNERGHQVTHSRLQNEDASLAFFIRLNRSSCAGQRDSSGLMKRQLRLAFAG